MSMFGFQRFRAGGVMLYSWAFPAGFGRARVDAEKTLTPEGAMSELYRH